MVKTADNVPIIFLMSQNNLNFQYPVLEAFNTFVKSSSQKSSFSLSINRYLQWSTQA